MGTQGEDTAWEQGQSWSFEPVCPQGPPLPQTPWKQPRKPAPWLRKPPDFLPQIQAFCCQQMIQGPLLPIQAEPGMKVHSPGDPMQDWPPPSALVSLPLE